jgi:pheromone shutdown protein TraB
LTGAFDTFTPSIHKKDIGMFIRKSYSEMTLDELVSEEKKMTAQKIPFALFVGILVGFAIWSATHKGGFMVTSILLLGALLAGSVYSKNLKSVQAEISRRNTVS